MSATPNYSLSLSKNLEPNKLNQNVPKYQDGTPFLAYKNNGYGRMTQNQSVSLSASGWKQQMNLPTATTPFRNGAQQDAINLGNSANKNWLAATQTLSNPSADNIFCTSNSDCEQYDSNYTCNPNYQPWPDSYGNQSGSVCSYTAYPELANGVYNRKLARDGGIGKACFADNDCNTVSGYFCNNETDVFGSNVNQVGWCAQKGNCPDGKSRFLGTPWNSSVPIEPEASQNNNGAGYDTMDECKHNSKAQQNCVAMGPKFYATYPLFCPTEATLRKDPSKGVGALRQASLAQVSGGFTIPAFASSLSSSMGSSKSAITGAPLSALFAGKGSTGMEGPLQYSMKINPQT